MPRIAVIIEDDVDIRNLIEAVLEQMGFETHAAADGDTGVAAVREWSPVVTTLDVSLPGIDGLEVAKQIRRFSSTYIVMLTARDEEIDVLLGLEAGADDYLSKPFRPRELRARIEAMLRRPRTDTSLEAAPQAQHEETPPAREAAQRAAAEQAAVQAAAEPSDDWLEHRGLQLSPATRIVLRDKEDIVLTRSEFEILRCLMEARGRVVTKSTLADAMRYEDSGYGYISATDARNVEVHMANLRRKLDDGSGRPRWIETVRGVGYRMSASN
jgi:DNA-binding response OmpR family regulator